MAALFRPKEATYTISENVTVDTTDFEDHSFCGIMFPIEGKKILPVDHLVIESLSVRGGLGGMTVWVSKEDEGMTLDINDWIKVYDGQHSPSWRKFVELKFDTKIKLRAGQVRGVYVHSSLAGDQGLIYDNQKDQFTHRDNFITVHPGYAHVCNKPFGKTTMWGYGTPWRDRREFVGKIKYGVVYQLFNPECFHNFGTNFQQMTRVLFMCQRRFESPFALLGDECIYYILNMCRWDWAGDNGVYGTNTEHDNDEPMEDNESSLLAAQSRARSIRNLLSSSRRFHSAAYFWHHQADEYENEDSNDEDWYESDED